MSAIGWVMIAYSSNCLISQEWLASIAEGDSIINATLLYYLKWKCASRISKTENVFQKRTGVIWHVNRKEYDLGVQVNKSEWSYFIFSCFILNL